MVADVGGARTNQFQTSLLGGPLGPRGPRVGCASRGPHCDATQEGLAGFDSTQGC